MRIPSFSHDCYAQPPPTEYNALQSNTMIREYISAALAKAQYETLPDDGSYYGEIPDFNGVYANAPTLEECRNLLEEVLEEWLLLRISRNKDIPVIAGIALDTTDRGSRKTPECRPGALEPKQTFTPHSDTPAPRAS